MAFLKSDIPQLDGDQAREGEIEVGQSGWLRATKVNLQEEPDIEQVGELSMPINVEKALGDLAEIYQSLHEIEVIEERNAKLEEEKLRLLPGLFDKIVKNPEEREVLKRILAPLP